MSGNAFSYRSMAVWITNMSHGVSVIEHLPIGFAVATTHGALKAELQSRGRKCHLH
jgi:hypothetical protein